MSLLPSKRQPDHVLSHWFALLDSFQFSTVDFYNRLTNELAARKVPRMKVRQVDYYEGSIVSDKRLYLRLSRERFSFEVCAAPFGTCYFFSLRFVELPRGGWLQFLMLLFLAGVASALLFWLGVYATFRADRWFWWLLVGLIALGLGISAYRHKRRLAEEREDGAPVMPDFDAFLLSLPVIGAWYEKRRKDTFYRHDTRLMYQTLVTEIVMHVIEDVTSARGVRLLETYDYNPILDGLYRRKPVPLPEPATT